MSPALSAVAEIVAPLGVLGVFVFAMRAIFTADRREREAVARMDEERRRTAGTA